MNNRLEIFGKEQTMRTKTIPYRSIMALAVAGLLAAPAAARADVVQDWYNWSGTQTLDHDRQVTRYIAVGYGFGNSAILYHTAGTLYHSFLDVFVIGNNGLGSYMMSGTAALNAVNGTEELRIGNGAGQGLINMSGSSTATVGLLRFYGPLTDLMLLSGSASFHATDLSLSGADYISFEPGCSATLTVANKVLADYQALVTSGNIRVDMQKQADFSAFRVSGHTLSLASAVPLAPTALFTASPTNGWAPLTVTFTNTSAAGSAAITNCFWDFGDSGGLGNTNTAPAATVSHTYDLTGTYRVILLVSDAGGLSDAVTNAISVTVRPPLQRPLLRPGAAGSFIDPATGRVAIKFTSQNGVAYRLKFAADLLSPDWQPCCAPVVASGAQELMLQDTNDITGVTHRFYRVEAHYP